MKERRFKVNGLMLNCLDYGGEGKPPVLFLHGGSAHAHWWDRVAPVFSNRYHTLALDQRGHGDSDWASEWAYGSRHYVSDLEQIIAHWGFGTPILVGHSMGGHNILLYAAAYNRLPGIAVIDTIPEYTEIAVNFLRSHAEKPSRRFISLEEAVGHFNIMPRETLATRELIESLGRHSYKRLQEGIWTHKFDRRTLIREPLSVWEGLPRITCPALVIKVAQSPLLAREEARKMVGMLSMGQYAEILDSYHHVMLDNPSALIAVLQNFFSCLTQWQGV